MRGAKLLPILLLALPLTTRADDNPIPPGLTVRYQDGKIAITARDRSVKEILKDVAAKAGFTLEGDDLLPEERVSVLLPPRLARREVPNLLSLAPKVNYVVVYADDRNPGSPIVKVALFPREGIEGVVKVSGGASGSYTPPPPPPPHHYTPPPLPPPLPDNAPPPYIPPETPPVYIPPESPPVYIPPDSPPQYIPADGPPVYIPPAPAQPPGLPQESSPIYPPPFGEERQQ